MDPSVIARPELTFSPEVADFARKACAKAGIILEYGRGSSTVLASEMERKTVFSVESDKRWATNLQACLDQAGTCPPVHLHHTSIGKTGKWGHPVDHAGYRRHRRYHTVERFSEPVAMHGRMAKFVLGKRAVSRDALTRVIGAFTNAF